MEKSNQKLSYSKTESLNPFRNQCSNSGSKFENATPDFDHSFVLCPKTKKVLPQSQTNIFNFKSLPLNKKRKKS